MARITQIGRVIIPSPDQDASIAFYTENLGFTVAADVGYGDGNRWVELAAPGGGTNIALGPPMGSFQPPHNTGIAISTKDARADHEQAEGGEKCLGSSICSPWWWWPCSRSRSRP